MLATRTDSFFDHKLHFHASTNALLAVSDLPFRINPSLEYTPRGLVQLVWYINIYFPPSDHSVLTHLGCYRFLFLLLLLNEKIEEVFSLVTFSVQTHPYCQPKKWKKKSTLKIQLTLSFLCLKNQSRFLNPAFWMVGFKLKVVYSESKLWLIKKPSHNTRY